MKISLNSEPWDNIQQGGIFLFYEFIKNPALYPERNEAIFKAHGIVRSLNKKYECLDFKPDQGEIYILYVV